MAFLRTGLTPDNWPSMRNGRLLLRPPGIADYGQWAELRAVSREHLRPWEPEWARDELSRAAYRRRLRYYQKDMREEVGYAFFIIHENDQQLVGGLTLSNIRRGVTQAASIGYWIGLPYVRRGFMTSAVALATHFVFENLRLHRIEAACLPKNTSSITVLESNNFRREGLARKYLKIDGQWQDHILFALLQDDILDGVDRTK
ncbi:MAG: GNAT family N-acetyltransferase [Hyphomicrobiaceae bacterium]